MSVSAPCAINTENPERGRGDEDVDFGSQEGWQSLSCLTDSTEQSAPINFDMSNRAKLPRGIENIRPHLKNVDNVPLLVSLFTDCTPSTTQQMIDIMQDFDEIVCVMGSSANSDNSTVFLKANISVSVEPLYPQVCQQVPVYKSVNDSVSPIQLSQKLNSLPCSVSIARQRPISLFHLIMHARHFMQSLWNCIQFWICSSVAISLLQLITTLVMLPPLFSTGQVLWLSCILIPTLSLSLVNSSMNPQVMQRPGSKNRTGIKPHVVIFVLWCYGLKFLPSLLLIPMFFGTILSSYCHSIVTITNGNCTLVYPIPKQAWGGWEQYYQPLSNAQILAATLFAFHAVTVSISFVHREYLCWQRIPLKNKFWFATCLILLLTQCLYAALVMISTNKDFNYDLETPWAAYALAAASPLIIFLVNEFVKWQEIKANLRSEKRARLDFGTKLGMNSPF